MEFSFYLLLVIACLVLVLAMWACAASSTTKWGPDLTLELPPHVIQEALFGTRKAVSTRDYIRNPVPSAPTELPYAPLLCNEQPMAMSSPPLKTFNPSAGASSGATVLVLPPRVPQQHKIKPVFYKFSTGEPV